MLVLLPTVCSDVMECVQCVEAVRWFGLSGLAVQMVTVETECQVL